MPFFSVIIPLFNKEKHIEHSLKSVLLQEFNDFEIIIVNDGCTDKSLDVISQINDKRIRIINQNNLGVSVARNKGISEAKADYIALLDADDIWHTNHLKELKRLINTLPNAGLFCANYEIVYNEKLCLPAKFNFTYNDKCIIVKDYFKASIINSVAWTSAVCFTKESFIEIGEFDTHLKTGQDIDLWIRYALKYKIAFNPKITMTYNIHVSKSLSKEEYNEIRYQYINKFEDEEKNNSSLKIYLDINRYALAIRSKINNDINIYKKIKNEINYKNLNFKQKLLLSTPRFLLVSIKQFQQILKRNNVYLTAYN
ncbi:MAG: glycosyltransferase [Flavobacteriaceae bacterium]|nr:glycosyltransferase [Flavobacteriaceae bacterium]